MGKASRRKKEKRAQAVAAKTKKAEPRKGRKVKKSLKKVIKKVAPAKKQQKKQEKPQKKVTLAALEEKAAAVEKALSSVVKKAQEVNAGKETAPEPRDGLWANVKETATYYKDSLKEGMDPEKLEAFKKEVRFIAKKGGTYLIGIVSVVAILVVVELHSNGRTFPGAVAAGVDVGYLPLSKAQEKLAAEVDSYLQQPTIFSFEGDTFEMTKEELGIDISADETMLRIAISEFKKESPVRLAASLFMQQEVPASYSINDAQVIDALENKLFLKDKRARNARFVFQDGNLTIEPDKAGVAINRDKLIADLADNIKTLGTATVDIEIQDEEPVITAEKLELEKDRLIGLLNKPINLNAEGKSLSLKLIDHLNAVHFKPAGIPNQPVTTAHANPVEEATVRIAIDKNAINEFLYENLIKEIERPVSPANIYRNEEGQVIIEGKGEDGRSVESENLIQAINEAVNMGADTVEVPVVIDKAPLTISEDLQKLGIKDLITTGHSAYYGSSGNRMFNIEFGAAKYNGLLIAPGEEFSFNEHLGEVDAASGFVPEKVIKGDELKYEYGGGICQVSTTMYRAALLAGLPITERKPHSWKVSYYAQSMGDGMDATIYPGVTDLKFINNTPGHILIQAYTEDAEAYFKIYGTDDGRRVTLDGPYGGGLTWRWNRTVLDENGKPMSSIETLDENGTEEIWSRYVPIPPPKPKNPEPAPAPAPAEGF